MIRHARPQIDGHDSDLCCRVRSRSAIGSQWSIPLRSIDGRPMPPLSPPRQSRVGDPVCVWQSGAFDFTTPRLSRNWFEIVSGLSRDWFGSLSRKNRQSNGSRLARNWFGIVSGFPRERLGEVGERFLVENCKKSYVFCDFCRFICIYAKNVVPLQANFEGIKKDCKNIRNEDCIIPYSKTTIY